MAGQWEVVSAKNKKHNKGEGTNKNAPKKKINPTNLPVALNSVSIKESQTMFDVLIEKEKKKIVQNNKSNANIPNKKAKDANSQTKKKQDKKKNPAPAKPRSLEEAVKKLDVSEMKTNVATAIARFPEAPMLWLQELASHLNAHLDVVVTDPCFSSTPSGYPACLLSSEIQHLLRKTVNNCPPQTCQLFFETCLQSATQDAVKGLNTVGYRVFLQFLLHEKPEIAQEAITKCKDIYTSCQNRQNVCLSFFWVISQAGYTNLEIGLKVWSEVMFPVLGSKAYTKYIINFLEKLVNSHKSKKLEKSVFALQYLFPILDHIHSTTGLSGQYQKQLLALYPSLKTYSYGPDPSTVLRNYFPSYLRRLDPKFPSSLKAEVLSSLVECLTLDKMSYSIWRQLYVKHLVQSSILISHLHQVWQNLPSTFPKKLLGETLSAFQVTNGELKGQGRDNSNVKSCASACNAVLNNMSAQPFPWFKVLLFATVLVSSLLAYDIQKNGSFQSSKTGQLMKDVGLLAIFEQAWGKITVYTGKAFKWLEVNVPVFSSWFQKTLGPHVRLFWEKLFDFLSYVWSSTQDIRSWANATIPPVLKIVSDNLPIYANAVLKSGEGVFVQVSNLALSLYKSAEHYSSDIVAWLHKNVLTGSLSTENLQKYAGDTVHAFQEYTMTTYNWISKYVATVYPSK